MNNKRPPNNTSILKVVILGDGGVGKSCLMKRFVKNLYHEHNVSTIGVDFMNKDIEVDGEKYALQVWDTAGQERFRSIRGPFYWGSDMCLLCYAIDDHYSFDSVQKWHNEFIECAKVKGDKFPFIVVGNKNDVELCQREVSVEEVQKWCDDNKIASHIETSSKTSKNVSEAFAMAVRHWKQMESIDETIDFTKPIRLENGRSDNETTPKSCCGTPCRRREKQPNIQLKAIESHENIKHNEIEKF